MLTIQHLLLKELHSKVLVASYLEVSKELHIVYHIITNTKFHVNSESQLVILKSVQYLKIDWEKRLITIVITPI